MKSSDIIKKVLPNGLTLLLCERHNVRAISLEAAVLAGSRFDAEETAGLAALNGRLLAEGTISRSSEEIARAIESVGGSLDSGAGTESALITVTTLAGDIDLGLTLCADVLTHPAFEPSRVAHERDKTLSEIRSANDRPRTVLDKKFNEMIYEGHPLHRPAVGYEEKVAQLRPATLAEFHHRYFVPSNACIAVAGDFETAEMLRKLENAWGAWSGAPVTLPTIPEIHRQQAPREAFVEMDKEQVNLYVGHLGIRRSNPDYYALSVLDVILGSAPGFTSRIPKRLRDEQGLAYSTFANITPSAGLDPGRFVAYIGTSPENRRRAIEGIFREIRALVAERVSEEELLDARRYLTGSFVFHFQTNSQIARFMIQAERYGLGFEYLEQYPQRIAAVTVDDVARVAATYLHPEASTLVVVGPAETGISK